MNQQQEEVNMSTVQQQTPIPPAPLARPTQRPKRRWPWITACVVLGLIAFSAVAGTADEPAPPTPSTAPIEDPPDEPLVISDADLVRASADIAGVPRSVFANVPDSMIDDLGREMCIYVNTTDDGSVTDNNVSAQEAVDIAQMAADALGITLSEAARMNGALVGTYCPNTTIEG